MARARFHELVADRTVLFDGGMGTMLYEKGVFISRCFDELNLSEPALVRAVHAEYVRAGADVIETNTFGANPVKLEAHGCQARLAEINAAGARLARDAAQDRVLVGGSIGPLGIKIEPWGPTSVDEAMELFRVQAQALLEGGVDLFVLETFSDVNEIRQAIRAVRSLDGAIPIVAQMTLGEDGNSLYGTAPEVFAQRLEQWGADVVGVNCSVGPAGMLDAVERMSRVVSRPISVQPNAGMPRNVDGRNIYLASPEYMSSYVRRFVAAGARIVGGCCGTTPQHVSLMRDAVRGAPATRPAASPGDAAVGAAPGSGRPVPWAEKSRLATRLAEGRFAVAARLPLPRGLDAGPTLEAAVHLAKAGIDLVEIAEAGPASARLPADAAAVLLEREVGVEALVRVSCRDRSLLGLQSDLLGAYALGLRNVVCVTGNVEGTGERLPKGRFEVDSIGLTNMVHRLNEGFDVGGAPIGLPAGWHAGVAVNPTAVDPERELHRFEWKVDAGAEFCVTHPVFDIALLERFLERIRHCRIPMLLAVEPLVSLQAAEFFANELPGCSVPPGTLARIRAAAERSEEHVRAEGVRLARELLEAARGLVQGAIIAAPETGHAAVVEIAEAAGASGR